MKDKNTIIIIDIVLITIAIALGIFLVVLNGNNNEVNINEEAYVNMDEINFVTEEVTLNVDDTLMTEYTNENLGFKIKYYNELSKISETTDESSMYKSAAMYKEEGNEGINVLIGNIQENTTLEGYLYASVDAIVSSNDLNMEDVVVIKENVKLGGVDAFKVRYKMDDINIYQLIALKDGKEYVVTYSGEDAYFDKQKAENMFSTFEFINK